MPTLRRYAAVDRPRSFAVDRWRQMPTAHIATSVRGMVGEGHRTNPNATVSMPSGRSQGRPSIRRVTSRSARKACAIPPRLLSWKTRGLRPASPVRSIVTGKVFDRRPLCCSAIRKNWQIASILGSAAMFFGARPTLSEPRPSNRIYEYAPSNLCHSEPWQMVGRSAP